MSEGSPISPDDEAIRQRARDSFLERRATRARKDTLTARRRMHTLEVTVRAAERGRSIPSGPVVDASSSTPPNTEENKPEDK
jgi:hypothetical protein